MSHQYENEDGYDYDYGYDSNNVYGYYQDYDNNYEDEENNTVEGEKKCINKDASMIEESDQHNDLGSEKQLQVDVPGAKLRQEVNQSQKPYCWIGIIQRKMGGPGSGFVAGKNIVLCSAHEIYQNKIRMKSQDISFRLNFSVSNTQTRTIKSKIISMYIPNQFQQPFIKDIPKQYEKYDWAILEVDHNFSEQFDDDFMKLVAYQKQDKKVQFIVGGYPGDLNKGKSQRLQYASSGQLIKYGNNMIVYKMNTSKGQSGAPLTIKKADDYFWAIGIHQGGVTSKYNMNVNMNVNMAVSFEYMRQEFNKCMKQIQNNRNYPYHLPRIYQYKQKNLENVFIEGLALSGDICQGIINYKKGSIYIGKILNQKRHGLGKQSNLQNGNYLEGMWYEDKFIKGFAKLIKPKFYFEGRYFLKKRNGLGELKLESGQHYKGMFKDNKFHGLGTWIKGGAKYVGEFFNDQRHGKGQITFQNGESYKGDFMNGQPQGKGIYTNVEGIEKETDGNWIKAFQQQMRNEQ